MTSQLQRPIYLLSPTPKEGTVSLAMIDFEITADSIDFSSCDTLIFTSKQAVKSAELIDKRWKEFPCVAIGSATKKQIEALGGTVIYAPQSFYGKQLSQDIASFFKDKKFLYLRPKEVSFDTKGYLQKAGIFIKEAVIYETGCIAYAQDDAPAKDAIIIFTSPSTIHCFFKNFTWDETYTAILIGKATKAHLKEGMDYAVADEPSIEACIDKARQMQ